MTEKTVEDLDTEESEEFKKAQSQAKEAYRVLKKSLKFRSKAQLIDLVIAYASDLQQQQYINQILLEENKLLKGENNEKCD